MSSPRKRPSILLWGAVLVLGLFGFSQVRFNIYLLVTYASGRAAGCPFSSAMAPINDELGIISGEFDRQEDVLVADDNGLKLVNTPHGEFWSPTGTDVSFLLAEQKMDLYRANDSARGIRRGDVVLDCGANIGTFVRQALDAGAATVVAIEVSPRNISALMRTFSNEIAEGKVHVVPEGVWHEDSTLQLSVFENSALDSIVMRERIEEKGQGHLVEVPLTTIDAIVSRLGLERVDFIKMDIEGAERNAIQGASETLRRFHPRLAIATENLPDDIEAVPAAVRQIVEDYAVEAGQCRLIRRLLIRPEVLSFY
jgi:FkbM family methyltransferase